MQAVLMLCYARSGGTLLNRCLGSLPGVVVLSEVSPYRRGGGSGPPATVREQAALWYGIDVGSDGFAEGVEAAAAHCESRGDRLVVRGWPVGDFVPTRQNGFSPPLRFEEYRLLADRMEVRPFLFVRDAIDVWISNGRRRDFFRNYRRYVEEIGRHSFPLFRYEDFCADPVGEMRRICRYGGLPYSDRFLDFASFHTVTGDVQTRRPSRGRRTGGIRLLPRVHIPSRDVRWCNADGDMAACNAALGYPADYRGRRRGPWYGRVRAEVAALLERLPRGGAAPRRGR